jgi:hypothetical protein
MPQVQVIRIAIAADGTDALVYGQLVDDPTKVAVASMATEGALLLAAQAHMQEEPLVLDMPDEAVFAVLELPDL